jgi:hypothetical protein
MGGIKQTGRTFDVNTNLVQCNNDNCTYDLTITNNPPGSAIYRYIRPKIKVVSMNCNGETISEEFLDFPKIPAGEQATEQLKLGTTGKAVIAVLTKDHGWKPVGEMTLPGQCN